MRPLFYIVCLLTLGLVVGMSGCSEDLMSPNQATTLLPSHQKSKLEMALDRADEFFSQTGDATRAFRHVESVTTICTQNTRAGEQDTLLFLVNYAENAGFALLGANPAINDIYAIAPKGHLTYEDIAESPVLRDFLYDAATYAIVTPGGEGDTWIKWKYWRYRNIERTSPLISSTVANWNQRAPYNKFLNGHSFVGCVPLSLGMFLSCYEKPKGLSYSWAETSTKFNFDWDAILYDDNDTIRENETAKMFAFLGSPNLLASKYEPEYTETGSARIVPTLDSLGSSYICYQKASLSDSINSVADFLIRGKRLEFISSEGIVYDSLVYQAGPLLSLGYAKEGDEQNNHAWIIDAVITRQRCMTDSTGHYLFTPPFYQSALPMWHCLWGMLDKHIDGWYVYLKDEHIMDSVQYDPDNKFVISGGHWPTGVEMKPVYQDWKVYGGAFPEKYKRK